MAEVAAERVLSTWESAARAHGHRRALALLGFAGDADGADLPLGRRDAQLLHVFAEVRGERLDALAECPACSTTLEVQLEIADLVEGYPAEHGRPEAHDVELGDVSASVRCLTTADLIAAAEAPSAAAARELLLARCVRDVRRRDGSAAGPLEDDAVRRLCEHLEQLDPLADVRVDIRCAECGHHWQALLDVPGLLWAQVQGVARRVLREVDALATRYGWSEAAILSMSEARRRAYLDLS